MKKKKSALVSTGASLRVGMVIWLVAMIWFLALGHWLAITPGSPVTERSNMLFHSDMAHSIQRLTAVEAPEQRSHESWVHPLTSNLWRPLARNASRWLGLFLSPQSAAVWAAKLLVISVAALAAAGLGALAISRGVPGRHLTIAIALYFLFSSNAIVVLPEHFGISHGLLALTFTCWQALSGTVASGISVAVLGLLTLGTTVTNAVFPTGLLATLPCKTGRRQVLSFVAVLVLALGLLLGAAATDFARGDMVASVVKEDSREVGRFVHKFENRRWMKDPLAAGLYSVSAFTLPVIGPAPHLVRVYKGKFEMLSYEPLTWGDYTGLQRIGLAVWIGLLVICVARGLRNPETAPVVLVLLAWIFFNSVFHNFWGDEFFLFSPHWSWALLALLLVGMGTLPIRWLTLAAVVIGLAQAQTMWAIRTTLTSLL